MYSIFPTHLYKIFTNREYKHYFENPVYHKETLERLLRRKIRIYREGQRMPNLSLSLLSSFDKSAWVEPSGVFKLPIHEEDIVKNKYAIDRDRYVVNKSEAYKAYTGAVYPDIKLVTEMKKASRIDYLPEIDVTQLELFEMFPGVHYNFMCRSVRSEKQKLESLIKSVAPEIDLEYIKDLYGTVENWLTTNAAASADPEKVAEMRAIVNKIMHRRQLSGEALNAPNFERVINKILAKHASEADIDASVKLLKPLNIIQRTERREGYTLLGVAAYVGNERAVKVLLGNGARVNALDTHKRTALMVALDNGQKDIATILLDAGANITVKDTNGWTPLMYGCTDAANAPLIPRLIDASIIDATDNGGDTALNISAGYPYPEIVQQLLAAGAKVNIINKEGDTPLITACLSAKNESAKNLRKYEENARMLIEAGSHINVKNQHNYNALQYAMTARMDTVAKLLVEKGVHTKSWPKLIALAQQNDMPLTEAAAIAASESRP